MNKMVDYAPLSKVWSDDTMNSGATGGGKQKKRGSGAGKDKRASPYDFENIFDKYLNERTFTNMDVLYPKMSRENTYDIEFPQNAFVKKDPSSDLYKNEPEGIADDEIGIGNAYKFDDLLHDEKITAYGHEAPLNLDVDHENALQTHKNMKLYDEGREENKCSPFSRNKPRREAEEAEEETTLPNPDFLQEEEENVTPPPYRGHHDIDEREKQESSTTHWFQFALYLVSGIFMIFLFELIYMLASRRS